MVAREGQAPVGEHADEPAIGEMGPHLSLRQICQTEPIQGSTQDQGDAVERELPFDPHPQLAPVLLKLPGVEAAMGRQAEIDAGMSCQILWRPRLWPAREVGGCPDHCHAHVRPDADGDHVLGHDPAEPHAGVIAPGHDVGQAIVDDDLNLDVRVGRQQPRHRGPENGLGRVLVCRDPDGAGGLLAQGAERGQLGVDLVEARREGVEEALACLSGRHAPRGASQQPKPKPRLEATDCLAQRRLRHAKLCCGPGEALLPCHCEEGLKVVQVLPGHS
jgi:hypothetical protein